MAIVETDIKLFASERMEDTEDGGGRITGNVIVSGQENNIFPDISRVNRVYGNISLRKIFPAVNSQNTDVYYGAHTIISEIPADPAVSVTLFSTGDWDDTRAQQREYVERYLAKGGRWLGYLFERQLTGQMAVTVWQRETTPLPDIGSVWALTQNEGLVTEYTQYVRITKYTENLRTFYEDGSPFTVRLLTVELSDPLAYDFLGIAPTTDDLSSPAVIRTTIPVDAAKYYGCRPLAQNAAMGAMRVQVDSIYNQLVPSAQSEVPAVDVSAGTQSTAVTPSASGSISFNTNQTFSASTGFYLGNGCMPGSLLITFSGNRITDNGGDVIFNSTTTIGTISYSNGVINFNANCPTYSGSKSVSFMPATAITRISDTAAISVRTENRGYNYTITLFPLPAKGSIFVDYMSQGKWYRLNDKGNGGLKGIDSRFGAGTVSYATGSVTVTCGALPDVGSEIIFSWNAPVDTFNRSNLPINAPRIEFTLAHTGIDPGSFTVTWENSEALPDNSLKDLGGTGKLYGSGSGTIDYTTGEVVICPAKIPLSGCVFSSDYRTVGKATQEFNSISQDEDGNILLQLDHENIKPGTVKIKFPTEYLDYGLQTFYRNKLDPLYLPTPKDYEKTVNCYDVFLSGSTGKIMPNNDIRFSPINYSTGAIKLYPAAKTLLPKPVVVAKSAGATMMYKSPGTGDWVETEALRAYLERWDYTETEAIFDDSKSIIIDYVYSDTETQITGEEFVFSSSILIDLTDKYLESIVPGSIRFSFGGQTHIDKNGSIYHSSSTLGSSDLTLAGTVNYESGVVTLTTWTPGATNAINLQSLLTQIKAQIVDSVTFRTPGAPLRPSSLYLQATKMNGDMVSATASSDGTIINSDIYGKVDYQTGVVRVRFGQWVAPAGHENEIWYDASGIVDGKIFKPAPIRPETLKFNCVVYSYLPLDASILGVDTVRLPIDGKVVVFKKADIVVVHNTQTITCTNPLSAGATVDCGRVRLAKVEVQDSAGVIVPASGIYTVNLDTGIVTFANPLTLTGYTQPLKIRHSVEDMALVTDVEINGTLSLNKVLSHDYAQNSSYVSTALVMGDLFARWTNPFSQGSWTSGWSDELIGASIIPQYNYNLNPIVVSNRGAIQQRWALIFTSATAFRIIGETLGQIGTSDINADTAPTNPNNGAPYFTLAASGWGLGWVTGNVLRFNTIAANYPLSVCRTVLQSTASVEADSFRLAVRGDIDR